MGSEKESEPTDEEDYVDDILPLPKKNEKIAPRSSVSAEAFGVFNKPGMFVPPKFEKPTDLILSLKKRLEQAFMFSALNPEEMKIVLEAM